MSFIINPLLKTDSYKLSHKDQYPVGLDNLYSNFTARGSRIEGINHTVHFGLQAYLHELQEDFERFFATDKDTVLEEYRQAVTTFVSPGFSFQAIADLHDLGYVPVRFSGVPEGTLVPIKVPSLTVESTHPDFAWLVNYFESNLSASIWHPSTVATIAWDLRRVLEQAAEETGGITGAVDFQLHDFSYRGMTSWQTAAASGAAHLTSFFGTDCVPAIPFVNKYYGGKDNGLIGASVPATEHSVMCAGGQDAEMQTFARLLSIYPEGILSVVSDTWSLRQVIEDFLPKLKDEIEARDGKLVIRPDSGDPADIICGTDRELHAKDFYEKGAIEALWDLFGGHINEAGYKVLSDKIGLIYGDGMTRDRIRDINARLAAKGFASTNWVAGVGSFSYTYVTRDTFGSAMKATEAGVNGERFNIQKNPETDSGLKKSATGRLAVLTGANGIIHLVEKATPEQEAYSLIQPVWEDGKFLREYSFKEVRDNLKRWTGINERNNTLS